MLQLSPLPSTLGAVIIMIVASLSAQEDAPILMKPEFQPGKTYRFVSSTSVYLAPSGQPQRQINMEQQARFDVDEGKGKGVAVRGRTERLQVSIQSGDKSVTYDSHGDNNRDSVIGRHFESTVNRYVNMVLNEGMRVVSHKEAGRSGAATPLPGLPRFGPEELVQIVNVIPQPYAPDPVRVGDEWVLQGKRPVGELGELEFEVNYQLDSAVEFEKQACFGIYFRGHMTGDIVNESSRNLNFQGSKIEGRVIYDPVLKMTRYSEHSVSMMINIPGSGAETEMVPMQQRAILRLMQVVDRKPE